MTRLKKLLREKYRSVSYLVEKTKISRYTLDSIAHGRKSPTIDEALKIALALEMDKKDIFFIFNTNTNKSISTNVKGRK